MTTHPLRHAALLFAALLLAGCNGLIVAGTSRPEPRYFHLNVPAVVEPLQVADLTGSVVGVELDVRQPTFGGPDETMLTSVPERQNAVLIGWAGGCEQRVDIAVEPPSEPGNRQAVTLKLLPVADFCLPEIPGRVIVLFDHPVQALGFTFDVVQ